MSTRTFNDFYLFVLCIWYKSHSPARMLTFFSIESRAPRIQQKCESNMAPAHLQRGVNKADTPASGDWTTKSKIRFFYCCCSPYHPLKTMDFCSLSSLQKFKNIKAFSALLQKKSLRLVNIYCHICMYLLCFWYFFKIVNTIVPSKQNKYFYAFKWFSSRVSRTNSTHETNHL